MNWFDEGRLINFNVDGHNVAQLTPVVSGARNSEEWWSLFSHTSMIDGHRALGQLIVGRELCLLKDLGQFCFKLTPGSKGTVA